MRYKKEEGEIFKISCHFHCNDEMKQEGLKLMIMLSRYRENMELNLNETWVIFPIALPRSILNEPWRSLGEKELIKLKLKIKRKRARTLF